MPKTQVESLTDDILRFAEPGPPVLVPGIRKQMERLVQKLLEAGFTILPPGAGMGPVQPPTSSLKHPVHGTSVRCPGCGAIDPGLLFKSEFREIPQGDGNPSVKVGIAYIACAKETCHTILSVAAAPVPQQPRVQ